MIEKHEGKSLEHMIVTSLALREISSHFNSTYCSCIPDTIIKNTILASNDTRQCRVHELKSVTLNVAISQSRAIFVRPERMEAVLYSWPEIPVDKVNNIRDTSIVERNVRKSIWSSFPPVSKGGYQWSREPLPLIADRPHFDFLQNIGRLIAPLLRFFLDCLGLPRKRLGALGTIFASSNSGSVTSWST